MLDKLYKIIKYDENVCTIQLSDSTHPVFIAHFPTQPILPGFLIIDIFAQIFDCEILKIKKAKFISTVKPDETITFKVEDKINTIKVVVEDFENKKIAEVLIEKR